MKQNIVMIDFEPQREWMFLNVLKNETGINWIEKKCVSNQYRTGKIGNLKRYFKYFIYSFKIFIERKKYDTILCWQQFYGIIIGFYLRLFHVKKINPLYVMTFIFKPKKGLIGRIYYEFVRFSISSEYINKIICFSSTEPEYYSNLFKIEKSKFIYVPLGEELNVNVGKNADLEREGVVSIGFSNRDYGFLIKTFEELPYDLKIYADHDEVYADNIVMTGEVLGKRVGDVLNKTKLLVIPLQDRNISAGQLTVLHAMQLGVPVVATDSDGIRDFIEDGKNGYLVENDVTLWKNTIQRLLSDKETWNKMSQNTKEMYIKDHTVTSMAKNIAKIVIDHEEML